jgi:hypothetical protein
MARPEEVNVDKVLGQFLSEGMEVSAIAEGAEVADSTIYSILERNGVPVRQEGSVVDATPEYDGLVEEYYKSPDPIEVIAARWGTSSSQLYRELGKRGMSVRRKRARRRRKDVVVPGLREGLARD